MVVDWTDLRSANVYTGSPSAGPSRGPGSGSAPSTPSRPSRSSNPASELASIPDRQSKDQSSSNSDIYRSVNEAVGAGQGLDAQYTPFRIIPRADPSTTMSPETASGSGTIPISRTPPTVKPKPSNLFGGTSASSSTNMGTPVKPDESRTPMTASTSMPARTYGTPVSASVVRAGFASSPSAAGDICPACGKRVYLMEAVSDASPIKPATPT